MAETLAIALMATTFAVFFAIPLSFVAARNLMGGNVITRVIYYVIRTSLNIVRSIESLIIAIVFVVWVGLGPFAGVMALTIHSIAALGKLYSEQVENIDFGPIEAVRTTGANWWQMVVYAVLPQVVALVPGLYHLSLGYQRSDVNHSGVCWRGWYWLFDCTVAAFK
jgi:phosphonate transport system permease protein